MIFSFLPVVIGRDLKFFFLHGCSSRGCFERTRPADFETDGVVIFFLYQTLHNNYFQQPVVLPTILNLTLS